MSNRIKSQFSPSLHIRKITERKKLVHELYGDIERDLVDLENFSL